MFTNLGLVHTLKSARRKVAICIWHYRPSLTASIISQKQLQYPDEINQHLSLIRTFIGKRTVDCVNLIKSYL